MYTPFHQEKVVSFKFPWEPNTARGFSYALGLLVLFFLLFTILQISPTPEMHDVEVSTVPVELLNFGDGDGTGKSKGNLAREGAALKGANPAMNLASAEKAAPNTKGPNAVEADPTKSANLKPVNQFSSDQGKDQNNPGKDARNIGTPGGTKDGYGLGTKGTGPGFGWGLGNIEWGGGGNRRPATDKLEYPNYKPGANISRLEIKVDISVDRDGITRILRFSQKGNPDLEKEIERAVNKWRFVKIDRDVQQRGTVTFVFKSN